MAGTIRDSERLDAVLCLIASTNRPAAVGERRRRFFGQRWLKGRHRAGRLHLVDPLRGEQGRTEGRPRTTWRAARRAGPAQPGRPLLCGATRDRTTRRGWRSAGEPGRSGRMPDEWRTARMSGWPGRMRRAAAQRRREAPGQRTLRGSRRRRSGGTAQASSPLRLERAAGLAGPDEQPLRLDRLGPCRTGPVRSGPGQAGPGDFRVPRDHVPPRGLETPRAPGAPFSKTGRRRRTGLLRL